MMTETLILPPGFHFTPSDQELITFYLSRKAMGLELPWNPLLEKTIYGENTDPWDVFSDVQWDTSVTGAEGKECKNVKSVVYVFTKLSKVNGKTRIARTAGCGTWDGQTGARKIYNNSGQLIGQMKMFTFTVKNPPSDGTKQRDHHWIMHEYSLAGVSLNCELPYKDYVMCRITRSSKEKSPQQSISRSVTEECSSSCGENPLLSIDNKKRSAAESQEVTSQKKQKVDSMSLMEWRSTHVGSSGDDNFHGRQTLIMRTQRRCNNYLCRLMISLMDESAHIMKMISLGLIFFWSARMVILDPCLIFIWMMNMHLNP
ncbi:NAC domain-containing protein 60 [Sesamum alatum]|uniref:NAC domain-containing protein 60 n=1 Tax=Sesamum alatum TaxID=300844 RepID=A0AAE2CCF4_9LAMI|nr:NAC domain-containing protein 60 [Sesamum alatum]